MFVSIILSLSLVTIADPFPVNDHASDITPRVPHPAVGTLASWRQKMGNAVDYKPGDEYEESEFEGYADSYAYLLPEAQYSYDADEDEDIEDDS
ncbi:hypothetical protein K7432_005605 [Basidiobolus ranarum]|uniref:Uncharacterized protein n=1 Tax=Basidiobolus ranarum TaxID=34480 RepID=A0ABR2WWE5_9FUNG